MSCRGATAVWKVGLLWAGAWAALRTALEAEVVGAVTRARKEQQLNAA